MATVPQAHSCQAQLPEVKSVPKIIPLHGLTLSQTQEVKWCTVVRIGNVIIFHLSQLWKTHVLQTVWCNISGETAGENWTWSLWGVKESTNISWCVQGMPSTERQDDVNTSALLPLIVVFCNSCWFVSSGAPMYHIGDIGELSADARPMRRSSVGRASVDPRPMSVDARPTLDQCRSSVGGVSVVRRPSVGRQSTDQSADARPTIAKCRANTVGRLSADSRPFTGRQSVTSRSTLLRG